MQVPKTWSDWASGLRRWGLDELTAVLIEAVGPFNVLLAQLCYVGQPFFEKLMVQGQWQVLTEMFEDQDQMKLFAAFLRRENQV